MRGHERCGRGHVAGSDGLARSWSSGMVQVTWEGCKSRGEGLGHVARAGWGRDLSRLLELGHDARHHAEGGDKRETRERLRDARPARHVPLRGVVASGMWWRGCGGERDVVAR
eukprot:4397332-Prymnesium_polylepis.1